MTLVVTHNTVATIPDDPAFEIRSTEWNNAHALSMASGMVLGRISAAAGPVEELSFAQLNTQLGVFTSTLKGLAPASGGTTTFLRADGTWVMPPGSTDGNKGDVTLSGGATVWTINSQAVTYPKIQNVTATNRFLGRISAGAGTIEELTGTQSTTLLDVFTTALKGLAPASGGGTTNFLRADGAWAIPPGGGGGTPGGSSGQVQYNNAGAFGGFTLGGDATLVTSTGVMTVANQAISYAKIQNVSATSRILGRVTAGAGSIEELTPANAWSVLGVMPAANEPAHTGDVTNSAGSLALTIAAGAVTYAKMQNVSVTSRFIGRITAGAGSPEELTAANAWTILGVMPAANEPAHTGDVTNSAGSLALTIANSAVTYAKIQNVSATSRFLGRISAGAGVVEELTGTQATTLLDVFTTALKGVAPASGGGTTNFLRADGTWAAPPGGGGGSPGGSNTQVQYNNSSAFGGITNVTTNGTNLTGIRIASANSLDWDSGSSSVDLSLFRDAANILAQRNGTNANTFRVYNTFTNSSNYERAVMDWTTTANTLTIAVQKAGTGSARDLRLIGGNGTGDTQILLADGGGNPTITFFGGSTQQGMALFGGNNAVLRVGNGLGRVSFINGATDTAGIGANSTAPVLNFNDGTNWNNNGWFNYAGQARVTADFTVTSSTTLTNVTGLSVTVQAGRTYHFEAGLYVTDAAAGGVQAAIAGTATATAIQYVGYTIADNAIKAKTNATALATAVGSTVTTETTGIIVRITGTITVNAAGTLTVQMAQNTSNGTATTAKRGSYFIVHDMP
jgi:hypothetical protein